MPSSHCVATHRLPALQKVLAQSVPVLHTLPSPQSPQEPPQSTSDSSPSVLVLVHVAGAQMAEMHTLLVQSPLPVHESVRAQVAPQEPPQSVSDSSSFFAPSPQLVQTFVEQRALSQSPSTVQASPSAQSPQLPPQSASDSSPFFTVSEQVGT
jgi:hypothetical protein